MDGKKTYFSIIFNIIFLAVFIAILTGLYFISGKKNVSQIVESTENVYLEKTNQMSVLPVQSEDPQVSGFEKYSYKYTYKINVAGRIKNLTFKVPIPYDEAEKQYITESSFSIKPVRIYNEDSNTIAEFVLENLNNQSIEIELRGIAGIRTYDYQTASKINKNNSPEKDLTKYITPSPLIESNDNLIKSAASKIKGNSREEIVNNIYNYVVTNINYAVIPGTLGAKKALEMKKGKCSEYSALMTALCRAKNIPARVVTGQLVREGETKHNWVEVYYDKYGWVAYEPTERPTVVTTYNQNGEVIKQERRIEAEKANAKYIASAKNQFKPWILTYSVSEQSYGTASVDEKFEIQKAI